MTIKEVKLGVNHNRDDDMVEDRNNGMAEEVINNVALGVGVEGLEMEVNGMDKDKNSDEDEDKDKNNDKDQNAEEVDEGGKKSGCNINMN